MLGKTHIPLNEQ